MNAQERHDFKKRLERMHEDLRAGADLVRDNTKPVQLDQASIGRLSRMDASKDRPWPLKRGDGSRFRCSASRWRLSASLPATMAPVNLARKILIHDG